MLIGAATARGPDSRRITAEILPAALAPLGSEPPDLGLLFATNHFEDELESVAARVREATGVRCLLGCAGEGIIGPGHEYERESSIALWLARLPNVELRPFAVSQADIEASESPDDWHRLTAAAPPATGGTFLVLGDPFTLDAGAFLEKMNAHYRGWPVIGGMASGGERPGQTALVYNDEVLHEGAVGVGLWGEIEVAPVVSQGCRPIGRPFVITRCDRNVIFQLGGRPPLNLMHELFAEADADDQALMRQGVFIGRAVDERRAEFKRGDFLIRNLLAADPESGAIAVGDMMRVGITVQFHVRDAATAAEDLRALLERVRRPRPAGVLMFSCNGRGSRMFAEKNHDLHLVEGMLECPPVAGFFCAGELGPIGGRNFIHGHTASLALFRPRTAAK